MKPTSGIALMFPSLNAIEVKLLKQMISEIIGEDEPLPVDDREWDCVQHRNQLKAEQRIRAGL